jgi:hypothetical protein
MDEQQDSLSFGAERRRVVRWRRPSRGGWIVMAVSAVLLACLGAVVSLELLVAHQNDTIAGLRTELRNALHAGAAAEMQPRVSASATYSLPEVAGAFFSVVVVAVRPSSSSAAVTWLIVSGQHADPGQRYGVISDTCGGQYVAAYDLAEGTADRNGEVTIVAPNLDIDPHAPDVWIMLYRLADGEPLGGVKGPLTGLGAKRFKSAPPC